MPAPWARPGSGFTLLFEAWAVEMARHLPAGTLAEQLDETDTRLWRSVAHYVDEARRLEDYMGVEAIGIDETSRRGRNYITVVADLVEHDVINVTPGKDPATVERFSRDFMDHNGVPEYVRLVACDMSLGFRKGIREHLPHARRIVDKFHVARHANEAVDKAGKTEGRSNPLLKRTKYLWLRNEESLTELQVETKRNLTRQRLKTGRACRMREVLQDIYTDSRTPSEAWVRLHRLCSWMMHSRLEPMKELARLFRRHFATIIYLTCGSSHINGSSDCDAQEQLRARLDCLLEPTGAGIDDLVDTPAGIWWGFRWHTGFQANPASGTAPDFGVGPVRMSIDCRLNRDRIRCPGSRFLSFFTNRDKPISAGHMLRNTKSAE